MTIDPGLSLVISFLGFAWIFIKKIYPLAVKILDEHIEAVKEKIAEAEREREAASLFLKEARVKKGDVAELIENNKKASWARVEKLRQEHEEHLKILFERLESSLKAQLEAEMVKQKDLLLEKISDEIIKKVTERINAAPHDVHSDFLKEDLRKLI
jgi:F0F1-type ATP synthase membrane subunit b/b'